MVWFVIPPSLAGDWLAWLHRPVCGLDGASRCVQLGVGGGPLELEFGQPFVEAAIAH